MSAESIDWGDDEDPYSYASYEKRYATRVGRRQNRNEKILQNVGEAIVCPACLRFRYSPIHLLVRLIGVCPGDN